LFDPATNIALWASRCDAAEKTLLTLENCGEPDSITRTGFSRSIGKTDNTQIHCPRASAIQKVRIPVIREGLRLGHTERKQGRSHTLKEKSHVSVAFLDNGQSLASQGSPGSARLRDEKLRLRQVPVEPCSARRILKRRTRIFASHVRRWLLSLLAVDMPFAMLPIIS